MPALVLITGATGLVGGAVARRWLAQGLHAPGDVRVRAFVRHVLSPRARALESLGAEVVRGDLLDPSTFQTAVAGCQVVFHAASDTRLTSLENVWAAGVEATKLLFEAARAAGAERFLFTSSLAVYGGTDGELDEDVEPRPWGELYGDAKAAAERSLREAARAGGPMLFILRLGSVYGPGCSGWTERPLEQARRGRLFVPGESGFPLPYLYVDNMVEAVTAAAQSSRPGTYDIFDGVATFGEFMDNYARIAGSRVRPVPYPALVLLASMNELLARLTGGYARLNPRVVRRLRSLSRIPPRARRPVKAIRELGWSPRVSLSEGMRRIEAHDPPTV